VLFRSEIHYDISLSDTSSRDTSATLKET
jgi:hypothetical protein